MYVITCNNLRHIDEYLLNRPGRFHYHFRFTTPSIEDTKEYLNDVVKKKYRDQIQKVIAFSCQTNLSYDSLRAIAYELNSGYPFDDFIHDLNIIDNDRNHFYTTLTLLDGSNEVTLKSKYSLSGFKPFKNVPNDVEDFVIIDVKTKAASKEKIIDWESKRIRIDYNSQYAIFDVDTLSYLIPIDKVKLLINNETSKTVKVVKVSIERDRSFNDYNFMV